MIPCGGPRDPAVCCGASPLLRFLCSNLVYEIILVVDMRWCNSLIAALCRFMSCWLAHTITNSPYSIHFFQGVHLTLRYLYTALLASAYGGPVAWLMHSSCPLQLTVNVVQWVLDNLWLSSSLCGKPISLRVQSAAFLVLSLSRAMPVQ